MEKLDTIKKSFQIFKEKRSDIIRNISILDIKKCENKDKPDIVSQIETNIKLFINEYNKISLEKLEEINTYRDEYKEKRSDILRTIFLLNIKKYENEDKPDIVLNIKKRIESLVIISNQFFEEESNLKNLSLYISNQI